MAKDHGASSTDSRSTAHPAGAFDGGTARVRDHETGRGRLAGQGEDGPGTLYGSMGRMMEAGLIRESDKRVDPEMDDERRIYYELTGAGRAALEAELKRYRGVVAVAEGRWAHGH